MKKSTLFKKPQWRTLLVAGLLSVAQSAFAQRATILIDDFESGDYSFWTVTGDAFGTAPAEGTLPGQQEVTGYEGTRLVNTFLNGDGTKGTLTSKAFTIERNYITFLMGGGANPNCYMELLVDGQVIYSTTPDISEEALKWNCWDVTFLQNKSATIRIVDNADDGWGHICVDQLEQVDLTVIGGFEGTYAPWTIVSGNAFGSAPATGTFPGQNKVEGWNGKGYINTFIDGDAPTGVLRSPNFTITDDYICFRIGGGMHADFLHADLYVGGEKVRSATANDIPRSNDAEQERLRPRTWSVSEFMGKEAYIEVVDASSGGWGHICLDDFVFSSRPSAPVTIENRIFTLTADNYLMVPTQNGSNYAEVTILDADGKEYSVQRLRLAKDGVDRFIPLYTGGIAGQQMNVKVSVDYDKSVLGDNLHTASEWTPDVPFDQYRPLYHHAPATGWMNDPNGMVYYNGVYHLFYQHYPYDTHWNNMHWGHATSTDLVNWEQQPIALFPDAYGDMFSGSIVVDENNKAGFGAGAFVAVYTSTVPTQSQSLAYSLDEGMTWHKYGAPVITGTGDFRDPKVFWSENDKCWVLILANGQQVVVYTSINLKSWTRRFVWGKDYGAHSGGAWECPDLIEVPIEGTDESRWVMLVSVGDGGVAGGSATQYFIGDFTTRGFTLATDSEARWIDYGKDNYAGVTWSGKRDEKGRPLFIGWMNNWQYANDTPLSDSPFRGENTFPRALSLVNTPDGLKLKSAPVAQLDVLRDGNIYTAPVQKLTSEWQSDAIGEMESGAYILDLALTPAKQSWKLTLSNSSDESLVVGYDAAAQQVYLDRRNSGIVTASATFADANHVAPLADGELVSSATLLIDRSSAELFINDGRIAITDLIFPHAPYNRMTLSPEGGTLNVEKLQVTQIGEKMAPLAPQPRIVYTIWTGEDGASDVDCWANVGDNTMEGISPADVQPQTVNGLYNPTTKSLLQHRVAPDSWHGIGFNLEPLGMKPGDANHFYVLVKKSAAGPVKLEMQIDNGEGGHVAAWASANYTDVGRWQALTFNMWEDGTFNDNMGKLIKTIYLHTHDVGDLKEDVEVWIDQFTAGYDMWNMPVYLNCFEGWNDVSFYNNIHTINAWNGAEVGAGDKPVVELRYTRTGIKDQWTAVGKPFYLSATPKSTTASFDQKYNTCNADAKWTLSGEKLPYVAHSTEDDLVMVWNNVFTGWNDAVTIHDGWQLVSCPVMQNYNVGQLINDNTAVYLLEGDKFVRLGAGERIIHAMDAFLVYRGSNAPEQVTIEPGADLSEVEADKAPADKAKIYMLNGRIVVKHQGNTYDLSGRRIE